MSEQKSENETSDGRSYAGQTETIVSNETEPINENSAANSDQSNEEADNVYSCEKIMEILGGKCEEEDSFLANGEGLDIYQLVAFQRTCRPEKGYWGMYGYNIFKALVAMFTQISSVAVLFHYAFDTVIIESEREWCDQSGEVGSKLMAISYTTFVSLILWSTVKEGRTSGFYKYCNDNDLFDKTGIYKIVDDEWLTFGQFINNGVFLSAFVLSLMIIFYTTDPLDIILNAVALLFIADIDRMIMTIH